MAKMATYGSGSLQPFGHQLPENSSCARAANGSTPLLIIFKPIFTKNDSATFYALPTLT